MCKSCAPWNDSNLRNAWTKASWTTSLASSALPATWTNVLYSLSWYFSTRCPKAAVCPAKAWLISWASSFTVV